MNKRQRIFYENYSYFESLAHKFIYCLPPILRSIFYRLCFKTYGKNNLIDNDCYFRYPWKISIESGVIVGKGCQFYPGFQNGGSEILLKKGVMIGPRATFFGAGHENSSPQESHISENITIEENVYIGGNCTILYGTTIGKNSVIGANSLVTRSIPANSLAVGSPARVIKNII